MEVSKRIRKMKERDGIYPDDYFALLLAKSATTLKNAALYMNSAFGSLVKDLKQSNFWPPTLH
jgi:hypothetical protein